MYHALAIGLSEELFNNLKDHLSKFDLHLAVSPTLKDAGRLLSEKVIHLLIADLEYLRSIQQDEWLSNVRHISFVPVVVLSNTPEADTASMVNYGVDMCLSSKEPHSMIADQIHAQFRRYTEYNHYNDPDNDEVASFQIGDIFIDPSRRIVKVRGNPISLHQREFSLLLYLMRHPDIVLTPEQICEHAWGIEGNYGHSASQSIYLLRQAIEPDMEHPIYIQTMYRTGYRFIGR